jgi:hypothetical protein
MPPDEKAPLYQTCDPGGGPPGDFAIRFKTAGTWSADQMGVVISTQDQEGYAACGINGTLWTNTDIPLCVTPGQAKLDPVLQWATPGPMNFGSPLGPTQLNATATSPEGVSLAGTFAYTPSSGTVLPAGASHTLTVEFDPTDPNYNSVAALVTVAVHYSFSGFFQPVDKEPTQNKVKAGSAIPIRFSLGGDQGLEIFAAQSPTQAKGGCPNTTTDIIEETVSSGSSRLSYDPVSNQYTYVWKTDKAWAGTCRVLTLELKDGTQHTALFTFTK